MKSIVPASVEHNKGSHPSILVFHGFGQQYHTWLVPWPNLKRKLHFCFGDSEQGSVVQELKTRIKVILFYNDVTGAIILCCKYSIRLCDDFIIISCRILCCMMSGRDLQVNLNVLLAKFHEHISRDATSELSLYCSFIPLHPTQK